MNEAVEISTSAARWLAALPWLLLTLFAGPILWLALARKIYPTLRWMYALIGVTAAGLIPISLVQFGGADAFAEAGASQAVLQVSLWGILLVDLLFLITAAIDLFTLPRRGALSASREMGRTASQGAPHDVQVTVENTGSRPLRGALKEDCPASFSCKPEEHPLELPPRWRATFRHKLTPTRRGLFHLEKIYLALRSRLGLWRELVEIDVPHAINVYPDMEQLSEYALLARTDRLSLIGVRRTRRIGQDSDFERLRDYSRDDNYRHIDWRTTARRNKLTVRQFQTDQSQRVIFLLDCGRMMTGEGAGYTLLDHSLNACLMLAFVALSQGDSVGMLCFSDEIHAYIPPHGGRSQMNRLLHAGYNQFPRMVESRYDKAFLYLSTHCRRRSLVVLPTNVIDEVNARQLQDYLGNLVGSHLPLGVLIRDRQIFDLADSPSQEPEQLFRSAAAAEVLCWRHHVITGLKHRGVLALDVFPEEMTAPLVNQYLTVKARHLL